MTMTDKEHAALEWLDELIKTLVSENARTLKAMLARPVVPSPTDHAAIDRVIEFVRDTYKHTLPRGIVGSVFEALHTPPAPKTKTVQVWWIQYAHVDGYPLVCGPYTDGVTASITADNLAKQKHLTCVRVTGPHSQEVPIEVAPAADGCRGRTLAERRA